MLSGLNQSDVAMLILGGLGIGFSKSGFSGISMLHVLLFAFVFGALPSTGILLPMLVVGDICAITVFGRKADWSQIRRLLPPTLFGILVGWVLIDAIDARWFSLIVGGIILALTGLQLVRSLRPDWFDRFPHRTWFALVLGLLAGITTMLANAAGPIVALYLLAINLPKWELIGTSAWLFLVLNVLKLPLSYDAGLIDTDTLLVDLTFAPTIPLGIMAGRWLVKRISQQWFNGVLLVLTAIAAIRLILPI
jgi:uncharacterized membrane protein YfcA